MMFRLRQGAQRSVSALQGVRPFLIDAASHNTTLEPRVSCIVCDNESQLQLQVSWNLLPSEDQV